MDLGSYTDLGKSRPINEDDFYVSEYVEELDTVYALVADGMGGHNAGEIASAMAVEEISTFVNQNFTPQVKPDKVKDLLVAAINSANRKVYETSNEEDRCRGMGTTVTACFLLAGNAVIAHAGDSRAYIIRGGTIHKITSDHSLVSELLEKGQITPEQARNHPQKNVITRAVGTDSSIEIDVFEFTVQPEDIILLCTDGLTNMLYDQELLKIISSAVSMQEAAVNLVDAANGQGGLDNITAVLLKV